MLAGELASLCRDHECHVRAAALATAAGDRSAGVSAPMPLRADPTLPPPGAAGSAPPPTAPSSPPPSHPATAGHLRRAWGPARRRRHDVARGLASRASPLARAPPWSRAARGPAHRPCPATSQTMACSNLATCNVARAGRRRASEGRRARRERPCRRMRRRCFRRRRVERGCAVREGERWSASITGLGGKCQVWALYTVISRWNHLVPSDVKWTEEMMRKLQRDLLKQSH